MHSKNPLPAGEGFGRPERKRRLALDDETACRDDDPAAVLALDRLDAAEPRRSFAGLDFDGPIPAHNATDLGALVRGYTKWDVQPRTLTEGIAAIQRAYQIAITPPMAPVMVTLSADLQKEETAGHAIHVPPFSPAEMLAADYIATKRIARALVDARNPRINVGRLRTPAGVTRAIDLVELLGAQAGSGAAAGPMSFPMSHPMRGRGVSGATVDFILNLEAPSFVLGDRPAGEGEGR